MRWMLVLLLLPLPILAAPSEAELAAVQALNREVRGYLVFAKENHIWAVRLGDLTPVDLGPGTYARWSGNGRKLAVYHQRKLYVMNPDGSGRRQIADGVLAPHGCAHEFHPNNREIIAPRGGQKGLWAYDLETGAARPFAVGRDYTSEPCLSADGRRLVARANSAVWAVDVETGTDRQYSGGCGSCISPDGEQIANNLGGHVTMHLEQWDGSGARTLEARLSGDQKWDDQHWSNHPALIAVEGEDGPCDAHLLNVDTGVCTRVTWVGNVSYPDLFVTSTGAPKAAPRLVDEPFEELHPSFSRRTSRVQARRANRPTRAALDFAAWHQNVMQRDPAKLPHQPPAPAPALGELHFGVLAAESIVERLDQTPLSPAELRRPMAWEPMTTWLLAQDYDHAVPLAVAGWTIAEQRWADDRVEEAYQRIATAWLHADELWVQVDLAPWADFLSGAADDDGDGDGYREFYARLAEPAPPEALALLRDDYLTRRLADAELAGWGLELGRAWYDRYRTETLDDETCAGFPAGLDLDETVLHELAGIALGPRRIIVVGRPDQQPAVAIIVLP